jgi:hypothetical protein
MAGPNFKEKITRLKVYADMLRSRLTSPIPEKHKNAPDEFKKMIERDLKKTLATIDKLQG